MDKQEDFTLKSETIPTIRFWPSPQDYNEALQNPESAFCDPELRNCVPELDALGLPRPVTGAFASVYKVQSGDKTIAVRCFLNNTRDQEQRYELISKFVMSDDLPFTVSFEYQKKGVLIHGEWFPILKMEWVEGHTLEQFVRENLNDRNALIGVRDGFKAMCRDLLHAGIAHGDLQHGNIMVTANGDIRLVDYDGMFVPAMAGWKSNELGHRNYQHPKRDATHFGPSLDAFACWSIYVSLMAVIEDPGLFAECKAGDDCLLFRREDYLDWDDSPVFKRLLEMPPSELTRSVECLLWLLQSRPPEHLELGDKLDADLNKALKEAMISSRKQTRDNQIATGKELLESNLATGKEIQKSLTGQSQWLVPDLIPRVSDKDEEFLFEYPVRPIRMKFPLRANVRLFFTVCAISLGFALISIFISKSWAWGLFCCGLLCSSPALLRASLEAGLAPAVSPELVARGVACEGMVLEKYHAGCTPKFRYGYRVRQGDGSSKACVDEYAVSQSEWDRLYVGEKLTILYADENFWSRGKRPPISIPYRFAQFEAFPY